MKYCLVGATTDRIARRKNETGVRLCAMDQYSLEWGDVQKIKLNIKIRVLQGFFPLISPTQEFAAKGLVILNTVTTKNRDQPLTLYVTCLSAAGLKIESLQYFAIMHITEEMDRTTPHRMQLSEWEQESKIIAINENAPAELIDFTLDPSGSDNEVEELTDFEIEESENDQHCSKDKKRKISHVLSDVDDDMDDQNIGATAAVDSQCVEAHEGQC
jgi:hypothetical protein